MPTTAPEPAAVNPLAHMANQMLGKHHVPDVTGNRTVYRTREKPQEPRKSYGVNPGTTASYNYSAGIPSPNGTYSYPQTAPATAPAQTTPSKTTGEKKVHDLIKRTANLPVDQLADVFESLYEEHDLEHPKGPHVPPTDFQPTEPEPVEPVQNQQPAPQENNDVTTNAATIKTAFKKFEPVADIYFGGRGVTVYASQMYALSMTLINIKDPSKREHRKNHILGTYQGWLKFIQSNRTRQWAGHYTNWYKDQLKKQKQQARSVGQQSLPLHEVRILALNVVAVKEGYPNWEEAQKLLDKAEFNKLIEKAAVLSERYHTDQLSQAKVLSTGPGPQENQLDSDGRAMLGLEETPIAMNPSEPNNPLIHSHQQANPATLNDRIERTRSQLKELSDIAEKAGNNLVAWERICMLAKGGFFMGLEQNLEQIRHGIGELSKKRKQGGVQSRGIDKNIG
jgi:hypothetical protein